MFKLALTALISVFASLAIACMEKRGLLKSFSYIKRQIIIGVLFGFIACLGTEFGVNLNGATLNARDAAPICAGLLFGTPAGIIAGVIGGVERWFAVLWGAGSYTRIACAFSTILSGIIAAFFRKVLFDDKKPEFIHAFAIALLAETIHITMVFVTNMNDVTRAFYVVKLCAIPLITINSLSVMLSTLLITVYSKEKSPNGYKYLKPISHSFQKGLLLCVLVIFGITMIFSLKIQTFLCRSDVYKIITLNISDVKKDVNDASDDDMLSISRAIAEYINGKGGATADLLRELYLKYDLAEINIVDKNGIITHSTNRNFIGFDMKIGDQSNAFEVLNHGQSEYVQNYQPISADDKIYRKYAGVALKNGGYLQIGYSAEQLQRNVDSMIIGITKNRHLGEHGSIIIADKYGIIVSDRKHNIGNSLDKTGFKIDWRTIKENTIFLQTVYDKPSLCMYAMSEGYYIIGVMPLEEAMHTSELAIYLNVLLSIIVFGIQFSALYILVRGIVAKKIQKINSYLSEITNGNLNVVVDVRSNSEFASLSDDINMTVETLKRYIAEAAARIDKELEFAQTIQKSALPNTFPAFPNHPEIDIFASMDAAKEVGGDFYDYYLLKGNRMAFLIADVSGKGIPAAMFMMTSKTLIKSLANTNDNLANVITIANDKLCENNEANMFITAFMGILDLNTGVMEYVNAGHNPPLIRRKDGRFEYFEKSRTLVLAAMEGFQYKSKTMQINKGDTIYLYTDGVTEATDASERLFGEERLLASLNSKEWSDAMTLCRSVKKDVELFVGDAPQFDDITMVAIRRV